MTSSGCGLLDLSSGARSSETFPSLGCEPMDKRRGVRPGEAAAASAGERALMIGSDREGVPIVATLQGPASYVASSIEERMRPDRQNWNNHSRLRDSRQFDRSTS